jgi:hypothetical protein
MDAIIRLVNCLMYLFFLTIIKPYIATGISKGSAIMKDTTITTRRQHTRQFKTG